MYALYRKRSEMEMAVEETDDESQAESMAETLGELERTGGPPSVCREESDGIFHAPRRWPMPADRTARMESGGAACRSLEGQVYLCCTFGNDRFAVGAVFMGGEDPGLGFDRTFLTLRRNGLKIPGSSCIRRTVRVETGKKQLCRIQLSRGEPEPLFECTDAQIPGASGRDLVCRTSDYAQTENPQELQIPANASREEANHLTHDYLASQTGSNRLYLHNIDDGTERKLDF